VVDPEKGSGNRTVEEAFGGKGACKVSTNHPDKKRQKKSRGLETAAASEGQKKEGRGSRGRGRLLETCNAEKTRERQHAKRGVKAAP